MHTWTSIVNVDADLNHKMMTGKNVLPSSRLNEINKQKILVVFESSAASSLCHVVIKFCLKNTNVNDAYSDNKAAWPCDGSNCRGKPPEARTNKTLDSCIIKPETANSVERQSEAEDMRKTCDEKSKHSSANAQNCKKLDVKWRTGQFSVFGDTTRHANDRRISKTCLYTSRHRVDVDVMVGRGSQASQRMRFIASHAAAGRCRHSADDAAYAASRNTARVRCTDVLHDRRMKHKWVGSAVCRRRTGSTSNARCSQRDAVMMMMLMSAFHIHLKANISTFPLSVVIHAN